MGAVIPIAAHALFSASGAPAWMRCAPKLAMEKGRPDSSSEYADEGTAAHQLGAWCLESGDKAVDYLGTVLYIVDGKYQADKPPEGIKATVRSFTVTDDMADFVQRGYVDKIADRIAAFKLRGAVSVEMMVEVRVNYSYFIGQPDSFGTSDVVLLIEWPGNEWQIDVGDLKYGEGVEVFASSLVFDAATGEEIVEPNEQMMLYALGALDQYQMLGDFTKVSTAIYQPRKYHFDEFECSTADLLEFAARAKKKAAEAAYWLALDNRDFPIEAFTPGEKQCRWCKRGGDCKARTTKNMAAIAGDFVDLDPVRDVAELKREVKAAIDDGAEALKVGENKLLDALYPSLDEIDNWVKAVRGEIEKRALAGEVFTTCKLALGKKGNRAFKDEAEVEKMLKSFRLKVDEMYTFKLITPTTCEKLLKDQPKRWAKLLPMIGQAEGKLSVVDINDKRPAVVVTPATDDFADVSAPVDDGEFA